MPLTLVQTVSPQDEPVTLNDVKRHLRVTFDQDDLVILGKMQAVRDLLERETRRQFLTATWKYALDQFPSGAQIPIPRPPLQGIDSVAYYNTSNLYTVFPTTSYGVDILSEPGRLYLLPTASWPSTYDIPNAVEITFIAGWTSGALVPASLRSLIMLMVGHLYENREASTEAILHEIPWSHRALMWANRVPTVY